jgi:hypothetical protein
VFVFCVMQQFPAHRFQLFVESAYSDGESRHGRVD